MAGPQNRSFAHPFLQEDDRYLARSAFHFADIQFKTLRPEAFQLRYPGIVFTDGSDVSSFETEPCACDQRSSHLPAGLDTKVTYTELAVVHLHPRNNAK